MEQNCMTKSMDGLKEGCGNACKENWCCRVAIHVAESDDAAYLLVARGMKVYKATGKGRIKGFVGIQKLECRHLCDAGCSMHVNKPSICKRFPSEQRTLVVLPSSCPFRHLADEVIEFMLPVDRQLTMIFDREWNATTTNIRKS
jgi:hypothetical protein